MAGKSWQPSHEPPRRKGKQAHVTLNKQWKKGGGKEWGKTAWTMQNKTTLEVHAQRTRKYASIEEHMEFRRMRI